MSFLQKTPEWVYKPNIFPSKKIYGTIFFIEVALFMLYWNLGAPKMVPSPVEIYNAFPSLLEHNLVYHLLVSFELTCKALFLSSCLSLSLAYFSRFAFGKPVATIASACRFLGLSGLTFIFTAIVGGGETLKLAILTFGISVFFTTGMVSVVWSIPPENFDHARSLKMGRWRVLWEVVILGTLDKAFVLLGQNAAIAWMMLATVEGTVRVGGGIGIMLRDQEKHFHMAEVLAMQIVVLIIGLFIYDCIKALRWLMCPHTRLSDTDGLIICILNLIMRRVYQ